jgi:hypothetical protein
MSPFARDQQDAALFPLDGALGADIGEVGDSERVHHAPGVVGLVPGEGAANRCAHFAPRAVGTHHIFGAHYAFLALVRPGGVQECHGDGVVALVGDAEGQELVAVVGLQAGRRVGREFGKVVQHAGLVDDEVRELADAHLVVDGAGGANDVGVVGGVRLPERHLGDAVGLGNDALREPEGLEGFDAARLDAVGLADGKPSGTPFDDPRGDIREHGKLRRSEHSRRTGADDQDVYFRRELIGPVEAYCQLPA